MNGVKNNSKMKENKKSSREKGSCEICVRISILVFDKVKTEKVCQKLRNKLVRGQAVIRASVQGSHTYGYGMGHVDDVI